MSVGNPSAKITHEIAAAIRADSAAGKSAPTIARERGLSASQVLNIVNGRSWRAA